MISEQLLARMRELNALNNARGVVAWDMRVMMPPRGVAQRARVLSTLATITHERLTDPELGRLLDEARSQDLPVEQAAMVERLSWSRDREVKIPAKLAADLAEASASGSAIWEKAREQDDFAMFAPALEKALKLGRERAEAVGYVHEPYEAHLEGFERGLTPDGVRKQFEELVSGLKPILDRVLGASLPEATLPDGPYDLDALLTYCRSLSARIGLDPAASRLDLSVHPFTSGFGPNDVRITTRVRPNDPMPAVLATMHEAGHGMYEAGVREDWDGTPIGRYASLAVHESQSRLWENHVGRTMAFWLGELPHAQDALPPLRSVGAVDVYRAVNVVKPSLIRVEADELTYPFHIVLRFELELAMARGDIAVKDLPAAWNDAMVQHLGVRPPTAREGVLQDTHWASGLLGYFPTYLLGSMYAAALFEKASEAVGDMDSALRAGDFAPLLNWMREKVHSQGALRLGAETIEHATGEPAGPGPYLRYLDAKFSDLVQMAGAAN